VAAEVVIIAVVDPVDLVVVVVIPEEALLQVKDILAAFPIQIGPTLVAEGVEVPVVPVVMCLVPVVPEVSA
jgi:hypothetical protein